jgi:hypothetical protein
MGFACVAVEYSSHAHSRLHARRVFNGVPCERGVVLGEARQMYVGDVGDAADACCLLVERDRCRRWESVGFGFGCGRVGLVSRRRLTGGCREQKFKVAFSAGAVSVV